MMDLVAITRTTRALTLPLSLATTSSSSPLAAFKLFHIRPSPSSKSTTRLNNPRCRNGTLTTSAAMSSSSPAVGGGKLAAPYGSWKSPITADVVSGASKRLGGISIDGSGRLLYLESRPSESGRAVLVRGADEKSGDEPEDVTPKEFGARTVCQEYGGGAFCVSGDIVLFSNYKDQRLYRQLIGVKDSSPSPITPDYGGPVVCYADGVFDKRFHRYITVREDRRKDALNAITTIVGVDLENIRDPTILLEGNDFYAFPRIDPKGERIAWIEWGYPNMPWDKSELWVGYFSENGEIRKRICVAGHDPKITESPTEPKWSSKGELFFITDRDSGFWNIYRWIESDNTVVPIFPLKAEFARPLWVFGMNSYEIIESNLKEDLVACSYRQNGRSHLGVIDVHKSSLALIDIPFTDIQDLISGSNCLFIEGASGELPSSLAKVTLNEEKSKAVDFQIVWSSSPDCLKYKDDFSLPELIEFPTKVAGQFAYAYYYPPTNHTYRASEEERPPLLLKSHGGPTSETRGVLNISIQFWTSRGWAFVDVNYGGSTGYGREFRERLLGRWGIVDVDDCCSCAEYLVKSGKVDGERLCITGGSAGGYTTLASLAFRHTFKAGASLYGVGDLNMLRGEIHKFESRYIDNLVGNEKDYHDRSPINFVEKFSCPIILFQGLEDKVVPPDQARTIYEALKAKGLPVALVEYEGEQHGFRKAENIIFTLEQQMVFFARLIGHFDVADEITPIKIDNFD